MFNSPKTIELATILTIGIALTSPGCASHGGVLGVDRCADIPAGAIPEPAGAKVCEWQTAQVTAAVADQTVLYQADFIGSGSTLAPAAVQRLARNVHSGLVSRQAILLEPSGDEGLDAARLDAVGVQLASFGVPQPVVEVATPAALGLQGPQAERVAGQLGNARNTTSGIGTPVSRASGLGGQSVGFLSGGIF